MKVKKIQVPDHTLKLVNEVGVQTGEVLTFKHCAEQVIEFLPQKSQTETILVHSLTEKIGMLNGVAKDIELEEAEWQMLVDGLTKLRGEDKIRGSKWYYLVKPLADAVEVKKSHE